MMKNFSLCEESEPKVGVMISTQERTFGGNSFKTLNSKRLKLNSKFLIIGENDYNNNLLFYNTSNPLILKKDANKKMRFTINKDDLNKLFKDSINMRNNKEIYDNKLFELLIPSYLVDKGFVSKKFISKENLKNFELEKDILKEREINKNNNKYFDRINNISFELLDKEDKLNKIKNRKVIKNCINDNCYVVKVKNIDDDFNASFLLKPNFTIEELKALIKFAYKVKRQIKDIEEIKLYYDESCQDNFKLENYLTMFDISNKIKTKFELIIYIVADY